MSKSKLNAKSKSKPVMEMLEARQMMSATLQTMGYLPDYQIANSNPVFYENGTAVTDHVDWAGLKQVNYFALLPNSDGSLQSLTSSGYDPSQQLPQLVQHASQNHVPVVVTVGGGDLGKSIPAMNALVNANQTAWTNFAAQIKTFCNTYGLAGVDLDWEPTSATTTQINNFATLIDTIKNNDAGLKISADVNGDAIAVTDAPTGQGYTLNAEAIHDLNAVNVMAYYETPTDAITSMQSWADYITGKPGTADVNGDTVHGLTSQLQFGVEVDNTTSPAGVVEAKVDNAIAKGYGGLFDWTLIEDTANPSIISRINTEITKDAGTVTGPSTGNVSGTVTANSKGLGNVTVYLDKNNNSKLDTGELHTTTNSSGAFSFSNVPVGSYTVREVVPTGDTQTTPANNGGHAITLTAGATFANENFVDTLPTASVSGSVKNASGAAISNVTVYLDANNNSKLDTGELHTTTNSSGAYSFSNVPIGNYVVREVVPSADAQTSPSSNFGHSITLTKGEKLTGENFIDTPTHKLTGTIIKASVSNNSTLAKAFDGSLTTSFHGSSANGNWIGLDLGSAKTLSQIKFAATSSDPWNIEGGIFQASNSANFANAVDLYTVPNTKTLTSTSLTTANVSGKYRYVRYLAPAGSFGDVAEIQFFGY